MKGIPKHGRVAIVKFLLAIAARSEDISEEVEARMAAISKYGQDPDWQIDELEKITAELQQRH